MESLTTYIPTTIETTTPMAQLGKVANHHAAGATFTDYTSRKATNTVKAQRFDLSVFADYLAAAGVTVTAEQLQTAPSAW